MGPYLAKVCVFGEFFEAYLVFGTSFNHLWQNLYAIGQILTAINTQTLNKPSGLTGRDQADCPI